MHPFHVPTGQLLFELLDTLLEVGHPGGGVSVIGNGRANQHGGNDECGETP
jgi:hypothetical protein